MATLTLNKLVMEDDFLYARDTSRAAWRSKDLTPFYSKFVSHKDRTFQDVPVLGIYRSWSPNSLIYGAPYLVLDPTSESFGEIRSWLNDGVGGGLSLDDEGMLSFAPRRPFSLKSFYGRDHLEVFEDTDETISFEPKITLNLSWGSDKDRATKINAGLRPTRPTDPGYIEGRQSNFHPGTPSFEVFIQRPGVTTYNLDSWLVRSWVHDDEDIWEDLENRHRHYGFRLGSPIQGTISSGSVTRFVTALGVPDAGEIRRLKAGFKPNGSSKKRVLDIGYLDKDSVGTFPKLLCAPFLQNVTYERTRTPFGYRNANKTTFSEVAPLVFGLTSDHSFIKPFSDAKSRAEWPLLDKRSIDDDYPWHAHHDYFWNAMDDRLLVVRSPLGWHGVFCLNAIARPNHGHSLNTPEAPVAYLIPTFSAFEDLRPTRMRFRREPEWFTTPIRQSWGLEDFLQQALYALAGAKKKMLGMGLGLDCLPVRDTDVKLPHGHLIRSWGAPTTIHDYDTHDWKRSNRPRKWRAGKAIFDAFVGLNGLGHVPLAKDWEVSPADEAPVQRVATTRRVLEV